MKIKYIDNDINKGIKYDYKFLLKEYNKLGIPKEYHTPASYNFNNSNYFVELSERSVGKTTNWLLFGMIMNKYYGTVIQYIRQTSDMITPKYLKQLFETIILNGYIEKITDGEFNNVQLKANKWRYIHVDENGVIDKICDKHFMYNLCINYSEVYKSTYNEPLGDLIILDEFISKVYLPDEFIYFLDVVKTIQRERQSIKIVMLANTLDIYNQYLHELCIFDTVQSMQVGQSVSLTTEGGTSITISIIQPNYKLREKKKKSNNLYYGFNNTKLNSIRGGGWNYAQAQHIPRYEYDTILHNVYILHNNKLINLEFVKNKLGLCIYVHWSFYTYDDSIIYTLDDMTDHRYIYALGNNERISKLILKLYKENRFFYSSNDCKNFLENYFKCCKNILK